MYIKRNEVVNYVNKILKDITLADLTRLSKTINIDVDKKEIENSVKQKYGDGKQLKLEYYDGFVKALKIYANKCFTLGFVLEMIAGNVTYNKNNIEIFDITIKDDEVLLKDIDRLLRPLQLNYKLMQDVKQKAENFETYIKQITVVIPNSSLINETNGYAPDRVSLTNKQIEEKRIRSKKITEKVVSQYLGQTD